MKKILGLTAVGVAVGAVCMTAWAVSISNLSGQSCGDFSGSWHFVNNQVPGAAPGTLTATWSTGEMCVVGAGKISGPVQHFYCTAGGTLTSASTTLGGRLVLSDFTCSDKKVCDPKTEKCD